MHWLMDFYAVCRGFYGDVLIERFLLVELMSRTMLYRSVREVHVGSLDEGSCQSCIIGFLHLMSCIACV